MCDVLLHNAVLYTPPVLHTTFEYSTILTKMNEMNNLYFTPNMSRLRFYGPVRIEELCDTSASHADSDFGLCIAYFLKKTHIPLSVYFENLHSMLFDHRFCVHKSYLEDSLNILSRMSEYDTVSYTFIINANDEVPLIAICDKQDSVQVSLDEYFDAVRLRREKTSMMFVKKQA